MSHVHASGSQAKEKAMADLPLLPRRVRDVGASGGYSHYVHFGASLTMSKMVVWRWRQDPALLAGLGVDTRGVTSVGVAFEDPVPFFAPRGKKAMELLHVERFRIDCSARGQGLKLGNLSYSKDGDSEGGPDFTVQIGDHVLGLECTTYALEERRVALGLLEPLRASIRNRGRRAFSRLHGMVVFLGFPDDEAPDQGNGLPFAKSKAEHIEELVSLIADHRPDSSKLWSEGQPLAEAHDIGLALTSTGASVHAAPLSASHEPSRFMQAVGFELRCMYTTLHSLDRERERLAQLVRCKDKPGKDWVLITVGGPDRDGAIHPAEELAAGLVLGDTDPIVCSSTQRVLLHRWWYGDVWEIFPERKRVVAGPARATEGELIYPSLKMPPALWPGRNDPCPCRSQRKFKACHGSDV